MTPAEIDSILQTEIWRATDFRGHIRWLYNDLVRRQCRRMVELGVGTGQSTAAFLCAAMHTGGHLTSVDIADYPETRLRMLGHGLTDRWSFVVQNDLEYAAGRREPIDALLIDTCHERAHTLAELRAFSPLMARPGVIYLHDTSMPHGTKVQAALMDWLLDSPGFRLMEMFVHSHGLAVVETAT